MHFFYFLSETKRLDMDFNLEKEGFKEKYVLICVKCRKIPQCFSFVIFFLPPTEVEKKRRNLVCQSVLRNNFSY